MSSPIWRPHGLIEKQAFEGHYRNAWMSVDQHGNIINPKKHHTTKLFFQLFQRLLFNDDKYLIYGQAPPTEGSAKAVDIVISHQNTAEEYDVLCFAEDKQASHPDNYQICQLEDQASQYCQEYFRDHPHALSIYACTLVNVNVRCWVAHRNNDGMDSLWGDSKPGNYELYLDVGLDQNREELLRASNKMKSFPKLI